MNWLEAFILGLIQGITEFLPISSTGHLYLGRHIFGLEEAGIVLDTMMHIGTLLAILVFYREELLRLIKNPFSHLTVVLIIGTIPAVIAGLLFNDFFDEISKTGVTIGWEFLVTGLVLWFAEDIKKGAKRMDEITYGDALFIGTFQAVAIFPAISRSGFTIAAALMRGISREVAAYFSFLLSIPAIAGAIVFQGRDIIGGSVESISTSALIVGTISSAFFGYVAVKWMIRYLKSHSLRVFAVYVWILGGAILVMQYMGIF